MFITAFVLRSAPTVKYAISTDAPVISNVPAVVVIARVVMLFPLILTDVPVFVISPTVTSPPVATMDSVASAPEFVIGVFVATIEFALTVMLPLLIMFALVAVLPNVVAFSVFMASVPVLRTVPLINADVADSRVKSLPDSIAIPPAILIAPVCVVNVNWSVLLIIRPAVCVASSSNHMPFSISIAPVVAASDFPDATNFPAPDKAPTVVFPDANFIVPPLFAVTVPVIVAVDVVLPWNAIVLLLFAVTAPPTVMADASNVAPYALSELVDVAKMSPTMFNVPAVDCNLNDIGPYAAMFRLPPVSDVPPMATSPPICISPPTTRLCVAVSKFNAPPVTNRFCPILTPPASAFILTVPALISIESVIVSIPPSESDARIFAVPFVLVYEPSIVMFLASSTRL